MEQVAGHGHPASPRDAGPAGRFADRPLHREPGDAERPVKVPPPACWADLVSGNRSLECAAVGTDVLGLCGRHAAEILGLTASRRASVAPAPAVRSVSSR